MTGILVVDKPQGWTSQDVCSKLRGVFHEKRVGHSGTLDPMATGVLPVFVGRATRAVEFAENDRKRYTAALRLGLVTDTQDITGTVLASQDPGDREVELSRALAAFTGPIKQVPPMYSAIKVGGRKLYELARRGQSVERPARDVTIYSLGLVGRRDGDYILDVECSKGTYIRTLCHDIGAALGCGGAMAALRRTRAGAFGIGDAHTMDEIVSAADRGEAGGLLLPVDSLFMDRPAVTVGGEAERRCRCGNSFALGAADGTYRVYAESGEFLMLGSVSGEIMTGIKSFFAV